MLDKPLLLAVLKVRETQTDTDTLTDTDTQTHTRASLQTPPRLAARWRNWRNAHGSTRNHRVIRKVCVSVVMQSRVGHGWWLWRFYPIAVTQCVGAVPFHYLVFYWSSNIASFGRAIIASSSCSDSLHSNSNSTSAGAYVCVCVCARARVCVCAISFPSLLSLARSLFNIRGRWEPIFVWHGAKRHGVEVRHLLIAPAPETECLDRNLPLLHPLDSLLPPG